MVAVINTGHSMHRIFNYNENKVKEGIAECIGAENFPINVEEMSLKIKLGFLLKRTELNQNVKRNSVHISLNFDPSENLLGKERLNEIANAYMQQLGFGEQPYLVYQHHDAGHPHIHLVTTNIEADGNRIDLHHLGIRKSEPARKVIEKEYGLVSAEAQKKGLEYVLKPISATKVLYGKTQTKSAIQNVLEVVLNQYKYTSLPELNAVLKQYNVIAQRGDENSKVFRTGGLLYQVLGVDGKPIGVPLKASLFYSKPTLKFLEARFKENETKRMPYTSRIKNAIDMALLNKKMPLQELIGILKRQGIDTVLRQNKDGLLYGITYVDHQTKCVFNGSSLGKQYSAKGIMEQCNERIEAQSPKQEFEKQFTSEILTEKVQAQPLQPNPNKETTGVLETLLQQEHASGYVPNGLPGKGKKKKKKRISKRL